MRRALLLSLVLLALAFSIRADDPQEIEKRLKAEYEGKVLTLRHFLAGGELHFDALGNLLAGGPPGPWTLYGKVEIVDVRARKQNFEIEANRVYVRFDENKSWIHLRTTERVSIHITYPSQEKLENQIRESFHKVFLAPGESLADVAPPYWRPFLMSEGMTTSQSSSGAKTEEPREPKDQEPMRIRMSAGVLDATVVQRPKPRYPEVAARARVGGDVFLDALIDTHGSVRSLEIRRPAGMGLDEAAIEAVRQWKYKPVTLGGKPVVIEGVVIVRFSPK